MSGGVEPETPPGSSSGGSTPVGGKPPRHHLTSIRHCASSARIAAATAEFVIILATYLSPCPENLAPNIVFLTFSFVALFAGPGCGDAELDLAHGHSPWLPAGVPFRELRRYRYQIVHGGRACVRR